jgi:hypothetical protein
MSAQDYSAPLTPLIEAFVSLGVAYHIGGSVASTTFGITRTTLDIDLVADIRLEHIHPLVEHLQSEYYIDEDMIRDAVRDKSSFNLIHLPTMFKVDVFILKATPYDQQAFLRADIRSLDNDPDSAPFFIESAEDVVLNKLRWYRLGGEVSERQWNDVIGVLRVQFHALDVDYLQHWASELGVLDLLSKAMEQVEG